MSTVVFVHLSLTGGLLAVLGAVTLVQALVALGRERRSAGAVRSSTRRGAGVRTGEVGRHQAA